MPPQEAPKPSSESPINLYPGLDNKLQAAFARNVEQGNVIPETVAIEGLKAVVQHTLQQRSETSASREFQQWLLHELGGNGNNGAFSKWQRYDDLLPVPTPDPLDMLNAPQLAKKYLHLYEAKLALDASLETTPSGEPIGETMHLVAIPWQAFKDNVERLEEWINLMRRRQGINENDYFNGDLLEAIIYNKPMYKMWDNPGVLYTTREYLDYRISQDGPWGVILVQISNEAGIHSWRGQSPDELTSHGTDTPLLEGQPVGCMGFLEWLALTLQEDPKQLSSHDYSWLLANRLTVDGDPQVLLGNWNDGQVGSGLSQTDDRDILARPRLAVM